MIPSAEGKVNYRLKVEKSDRFIKAKSLTD